MSTDIENPEVQTPEYPENTPETPQETPQETPEAPAKTARAKPPDTSTIKLDDINGAALALEDLITASEPVRVRSAQQKAMDAVAVKAYEKWREAGKPTAWNKIPVITYFLDPSEVPGYRYLIRHACAIVPPAADSVGVRVRFGNEFTLSEAMAAKIGAPDKAGKIVLTWAAVDKRANETGKATGTPEHPENAPGVPADGETTRGRGRRNR